MPVRASVTIAVVVPLMGASRKPAEARPSGAEAARIGAGSSYMTSVPFVALIACPPDDSQWLLNVEPPEKVIVSAISCVH